MLLAIVVILMFRLLQALLLLLDNPEVLLKDRLILLRRANIAIRSRG